MCFVVWISGKFLSKSPISCLLSKNLCHLMNMKNTIGRSQLPGLTWPLDRYLKRYRFNRSNFAVKCTKTSYLSFLMHVIVKNLFNRINFSHKRNFWIPTNKIKINNFQAFANKLLWLNLRLSIFCYYCRSNIFRCDYIFFGWCYFPSHISCIW